MANNIPVECALLSLSWSVHNKVFVAVLGCGGSSSFSYSYSENLIEWTGPSVFYTEAMLPNSTKPKVVGMMYPALVDPKAPSELNDPNFGTV